MTFKLQNGKGDWSDNESRVFTLDMEYIVQFQDDKYLIMRDKIGIENVMNTDCNRMD